MKKKSSKVERTDPNLTGQPMVTNQNQPKVIPPEMMTTAFQYSKIKVSENPNKELQLSSGALIQKRVDTVSGSVGINKYYVLLQSENGLYLTFKSESEGNKINSKYLKMNIKHISSKKEEITNLCPVYARVNYSSGFCCGESWKIIAEPHQSFIGEIKNISKNGCEIYDDRGELCKIKNFVILRNDKLVGTINKKMMSIDDETPPAETYELSFPSDANNDSKIILIFATMLIDLKNLIK